MTNDTRITGLGAFMGWAVFILVVAMGAGPAAAESAAAAATAGICTGPDSDGDGVPDACDVCPGFDDALDQDGDGIPNGCDACAGGAGTADSDADGNRNWDDYAKLAACLDGPFGGLGDGCECFDFGPDSDVDLRDARRFLNSVSLGPGCIINGVFHEAGKRDAYPRNCRVCRSEVSTTGWSLMDEGAICDAGSGDLCDPAERCDGVTGMCPEDNVASAETVCNPGSGDECDPDELCTGVADEPCPTDRVAPEGLVCRPGSGDICDPPERCTGVANETCPDDLVAPQGLICNEGAGDICDPHERCSGNPGEACPEDTVAAAGTVCNEGSGDICDPDEACSGVAEEACPKDRVRASDFVCRPSGGECDVEELCTGNPDDGCPENVKLGAETVCREAAGICDVEEVCDGVHNACPPDMLYSSEQVCRAAGVTIEPDGTVFIDGDGLCDVPEYCTGTNINCPPDRLRPEGALCRDRAGVCDSEREFCSGSSKHCPLDVSTGGRRCRIPYGNCDEPEYCDPADSAYPDCPEDTFKPAGTLCRDLGPDGFPNFQACDVQEFCDGQSAACPTDEGLPVDTACTRGDGSTGACEDVGVPKLKCVEAGTIADGDLCDAGFECASGNCAEQLDRSYRCIPANLVGFGGACDGRDYFYEGDPEGRQCMTDGGDQLWCCKNGLPAATGQTGTCSECCRNDDTQGGTGKGVVGCDSTTRFGSRTECCSGRCSDPSNDPYNCGECGINCYDEIDMCKTAVIECDGGSGVGQPGTCVFETPCDGAAGEVCYDSCFSCAIMGTCATCQSIATCSQVCPDCHIIGGDNWCLYCDSDADCDPGQTCQSGCGSSDGSAIIFCTSPSYCIWEPGDCVD